MPNVLIFDTETTSLDKPYCYNVGYVIADSETGEILKEREYIIDQIWSNLPLFNTAYYADKRSLYVSAMRGKRAKLRKWGHVTQTMIKDIEKYSVSGAYAFNSPFDDKVFSFNCEWFRTINPFDTVQIFDIRAYAHQFICNTDEYKEFCETNEFFSDSGNYSTTAECVFRFITKDTDFIEAHTALNDAEIETQILMYALCAGAEINTEYKTLRSLERLAEHPLTIKIDNKVIWSGTYKKKYVRDKAGTYNFKMCMEDE